MKKHPYSHTHIEHHADGSHTVHHVHESGDAKKDVKAGVGDHDGLIDHIIDHTSSANEGEGHDADNEALEEKAAPGLHEKIASMGA